MIEENIPPGYANANIRRSKKECLGCKQAPGTKLKDNVSCFLNCTPLEMARECSVMYDKMGYEFVHMF